jgi:peptidyl-prolyl cis-trans isomerase C
MKRSNLFLITSTLLLLFGGCSKKSDELVDKSKQIPQVGASDNLAEVARLLREPKLDKVKDSFTICSINDIPLTMGEYRRQLNAQMRQFQSSLTVNPQMRMEALQQAKKRGVSLTPSEKKDMLDRASTLKKTNSKAFAKMLKDNKATQSDFDNEVLEIGLATKTAKMLIKESLLDQLINRELLTSAAKTNGFSKQAINKVNEEKQTPQYQQMLKNSGLSPESVEQELIKNDLSNFMINKLQTEAKASDADARKFYEENKSRMKHGARIKLSQILIEAPSQDQGPILSLKTQIRRARPKMTDAEVDNQVKAIMAQQRQKAESLLTRALSSGVDFAELANQNSEDAPARAAKNGGDLGFQEESRLPKAFLDRLTPVKTGAVAPELIQSPVGYHIIKITAREPAGEVSFEETRDRIKNFLSQQKARQAVQKWLDTERHAARVALSPECETILASIAKENKEKNIHTP